MSKVRLNVNLDKTLYQKLKIKQANRDETITEAIIALVIEYTKDVLLPKKQSDNE